MKVLTIIIAILVVILLFYFIKTKLISNTNNLKEANNGGLDVQEKLNDKLVIVAKVKPEEIDKILQEFCDVYNKDKVQAQPRLYKINDDRFAIIFPFDIDFELYCYFVNYVRYPMAFNKSFDVTAWTTATSGQMWISQTIENKKIMLFIPDDDTEHDNVYVTSIDNIGYKFGFAVQEGSLLLSTPKKHFINPEITFTELYAKQFTDYR